MSNATAPAAAGTRYPGLDALRGLAALRIVIYHLTNAANRSYAGSGGTFHLSKREFSVPMFFVLSGFVIPLTLQRCRSVADFAFLRVTRLYPTFLVCLTLSFGAVTLWGGRPDNVSGWDVLANLTMMGHALGARYVDGVYWTLEVEVTFYLIMAALFFVDWVHAAGAVMLALALLHALAPHIGLSWDERSNGILGNAHLFAIGILLFNLRFERRPWHLAAIPAVCIIAYVDQGPSYIVWIAVFFALTALSVFVNPRFLRIRPLVWFGGISYPFYLLHRDIGIIVLHAAAVGKVPPDVAMTLAFGLALALAYAVHRLVELPVMNWARDYRYRRKTRGRGPSTPTSKAAAE